MRGGRVSTAYARCVGNAGYDDVLAAEVRLDCIHTCIDIALSGYAAWIERIRIDE
jgi:hypothetical protein